jgi:hypothetical protein
MPELVQTNRNRESHQEDEHPTDEEQKRSHGYTLNGESDKSPDGATHGAAQEQRIA